MRTVANAVAVKLGFIAAFVVTFCLVWPHFDQAVAPTVHTVAPSCDAACHAQGMAAIQARIDSNVKALEAGRRCYPDRLTTHVIVRGALLGTEAVRLVTFDRAWTLNHNTNPGDDVWVLARCD